MVIRIDGIPERCFILYNAADTTIRHCYINRVTALLYLIAKMIRGQAASIFILSPSP
ncbi:uncharacterized protein METZ01_LOCUS490164 [marine metagenome]|uniref:Uncharacterized protein n=1 Tax=marine metagenome TaxID=408172 RepID=A0A383CZ42_9ZZZZ